MNSARWTRISIVDGATRTRTPRRWHASTSSTACCWGNAGSAMMTSSTRCSSTTRSIWSSVPSEGTPLSGRGCSDTKPTTLMIGVSPVLSALATASM